MAITSPLEILTYANLSNAAYGNGAVPIGWNLLKSETSVKTGFAAVAVQNEATGEIVIAYRGTDGFDDLTGSDLQLALQNDVPNQYPEAAAFYSDVQNEYGVNITITGHSLGGALAQLVAAIEGGPAYTFNAPGVSEIRQYVDGFTDPSADPESCTNISNLNMAFDAVSTRGVQLGSITNYDPSALEGLAVFSSLIATNLNPTLGVLVFGKTILGQHYIDRLEEAIATPKPIDYINGYTYDSQTGEWTLDDADGTSFPVDVETAATLTALREENQEYNARIAPTQKWLTQYRHWQTATEQLRAQYGQVWTDFDPEFDSIGWIQDTKGNYIAQFEIYEEDGQTFLRVLGEDGQTVNLSEGSVSGSGTLFRDFASGVQTLVDSVSAYGPIIIDALSLVCAIQSGKPLPIAASGLRLANDLASLDGIPNLNLSGASNAASGILSVLSLSDALEQGDAIGAVTAGAQAIQFGAQAYADFAFEAVFNGSEELIDAAWAAQGVADAVGEVLPYLNLVNSIAQGDPVGSGVALLNIINPVTFGPLGIAYAVFNLIEGLLNDVPDPWGSGQFVWDGTGIRIQAVGETGGEEAVSGAMDSVIATLNALIEREREQNPGSQLGIIPNRMPTIGYDMSGYRYADIDPLTGEEKHPSLRFDTSGNPYNAEPGSPESFQSIIEGVVRSSLSRGAVAPLWEVQTAKLQTDAGDPKAGLTEEERAARDGQLAAPVEGDTQIFRPVALDLDGDGIETVERETAGISFDVDDSGFLKSTGWLGADDAFLTLDRNYNGQVDSGREMFTNSTVALGRRGLAGMAWVDANYDGKLTDADPVWNVYKVLRDLDLDVAQDAGEAQGIDALDITELNYAMGTFTRNNEKTQLASPDLLADQEGTSVLVVAEGIVVQRSEDGHLSLRVTRIDDKMAVEAVNEGLWRMAA